MTRQIAPGQLVVIRDLAGKPELNGQLAVVDRPAADIGRWVVCLQEGGQAFSLESEKLHSQELPSGFAALVPGQTVVIQNVVKRPELNGRMAVLEELRGDRWAVRVHGLTESVSIAADKLRPAATQYVPGPVASSNAGVEAPAPPPTGDKLGPTTTHEVPGAVASSGTGAEDPAPSPAGETFKMVLLGQTGGGKTSFLNLLCNFPKVIAHGADAAIGVMRDFHDVTLENEAEQKMVSKTSGAKVYKLPMGGTRLCVIDTPGFGDTRGAVGEMDQKHAKMIVECIKAEEYVNAICLVISGRDSRMTATLKYVLAEVCAILPSRARDHIIVVFTNTTNPLYLNFDMDELSRLVEKNVEHQIFIENPYVQLKRAKELAGKVDAAKIQKGVVQAFQDAREELEKFHAIVCSLPRLHTHVFEELYNLRKAIDSTTITILNQYAEVQQQLKALEKEKREIEAARSVEELASNFKQVHTGQRWVFKDADRHGTFCGAPNCHSNCHAPCIMEKTLDKSALKRCTAFCFTWVDVQLEQPSDVQGLLAHMRDTPVDFNTDQDGGEGVHKATVLTAPTAFVFQGHNFISGAMAYSYERSTWLSASDVKALPLPATVWICDESDQDTCKQCGHDRSLHYHDEKVWVQEEYTETVVDPALEKKYNDTKDLREKKEAAAKSYEQKIRKLEGELEALGDRLMDNIRRFEDLGLARNYAQLLQNQLDILEEHIAAAMQGEGAGDPKELKATAEELRKKIECVQSSLRSTSRRGSTAATLEWARAMLGVSKDASRKQIDAKYKKAALRFHPDKQGGNPERQQQLNEAYELLKAAAAKPAGGWTWWPFSS